MSRKRILQMVAAALIALAVWLVLFIVEVVSYPTLLVFLAISLLAPNGRQFLGIKNLESLPPTATIPIGVVVTLLISGLLLILTKMFLPWPVCVAETILVAFYLFWGGLIYIPFPSKGAVLFLGTRMRKIPPLNEGWGWTLPKPLMFVEVVNMEERTTDIGTITVTAKGTRMDITSKLQWQIVAPYTFLSLGESVVREGIVSMVKDRIRTWCASKSSVDVEDDEKKLAEEIKTIGDKEARKRWGIDFVDVQIESILGPKEVADAKAKIEQEKREAEAETIEANILTGLAKNMQRETGLPIQDCVTAIQRERGKIEAKEFLLGGNALTSVAAALGTWLTQKGGK